jgi:hypothetical protein
MESKTEKTKKATFTLSSDNHLEFLQCLLTKHEQNSYKVTEQDSSISIRHQKHMWPFSILIITYLFSFSEQDPIDIENATDYCGMVANLANFLLNKVNILMDIKVIRGSCGQAVRWFETIIYAVWQS